MTQFRIAICRIGIAQRERQPMVKDPVAIEWMRTLKAALDPSGMHDPGKVCATRPHPESLGESKAYTIALIDVVMPALVAGIHAFTVSRQEGRDKPCMTKKSRLWRLIVAKSFRPDYEEHREAMRAALLRRRASKRRN